MAELFKMGKSRALRINAIVQKEIKSLISDRIAILILFIIPTIVIAVLGTSLPREDLYAVTLWIVDEDQSTRSGEFITTFKEAEIMSVYASGDRAPISPEFGQTNATDIVSRELAELTLPTEYLDVYIILHSGFQDDLNVNGTVEITAYYDSIDITKRLVADAFILLGLTNVQLENLIFERDVITFPETRPSDILENINILALGAPVIAGIVLLFSMQLISTQAIVGDIPLKRLLNTSLQRGEVITGKIAAYSIIAVFQIIITMIVMQIFGVTYNCLWIEIFILLLLNSMCGICMGIFISTISKTRLQASQLFLMFFFVMIILQYFYRNELLLNFMPLAQTQTGFANMASRGLSLWDVWEPVLKITGTGLLYYILTLIYIKYIKKEFV